MELAVIEQDGVRVLEGPPNLALMAGVEDTDRLVEACLTEGLDGVLLHAPNLTASFFDLSSGEAGAILQKLRNYGIRLAVVCPPGDVRFSRRFGEMLSEEQRGSFFRVFETRRAAREWIGRRHDCGGIPDPPHDS
jgi:hypothetical protein